jgi:hypothetical protein
MKREFGNRFLSAFKGLSKVRQQAVYDSIETLLTSLDERRGIPQGLNLKRLQGCYWQIRSTRADRIVLEWRGDLIIFRLVGNHNDIRRFLKQ